MCSYDNCDKYLNNEPCDDHIVFCEKSLAEYNAKVIADFIDGYEGWMQINDNEYCRQVEDCPTWCIECYAKWLKEKK